MVLGWLNHAESTDSESSQAEWRDIVLYHAAKWRGVVARQSGGRQQRSGVSGNCAARQDDRLE